MAVNNVNLLDDFEYCANDAKVTEELYKKEKEDKAEYSEYVSYNEIKPEEVNHPARYIHNGIETIDVIKAWTEGCDGVYAFCIGNAIKYISRWQDKGGIEDLKKAIWYLQWKEEKEAGKFLTAFLNAHRNFEEYEILLKIIFALVDYDEIDINEVIENVSNTENKEALLLIIKKADERNTSMTARWDL